MHFLERLLRSIDAKVREEKQLLIQASANEAVKHEITESFKEAMLREKRAKFLKNKELAKKELERYSVKERLEAIRNGVWKVGEIEEGIDNALVAGTFIPPGVEYCSPGYYLIYSYPALIPIQGYFTKHRWYDSPPGAGFGYSDVHVPIVNGFREGRRFDGLFIQFYNRDYDNSVFAEAVSRCPNDINGYIIDRYSSLEGACLVQYEGEHKVYQPHPMFTAIYFQEREREICSPEELEDFLIDYSHRLIQDRRLPLQSEELMQRRLAAARQAGIIT